MPKISVVIPVFGVEKYIERCARSLFEQTLDDVEYIFVDDKTNDASIEILERVIEDYPRRTQQIKIIRHYKNRGLPQARKTGVMHATGDYVIHCDSDDWVDCDMLRLMYEKAVINNADVVFCGYVVHDGEKELRVMDEKLGVSKEEVINQMMLQQTHWVLWNKLFKRSVYNNPIAYPTQNMGEDMALCLQLLYYCRTIYSIDRPLYYYFYNRQSISNEKYSDASFKKCLQTRDNCNIVYEFYSTKMDYAIYRRAIMWLKMVAKLHIDRHSPEGKQLWNNIYPHIEFKLLVNSLVSCKQKKMILRKLFR